MPPKRSSKKRKAPPASSDDLPFSPKTESTDAHDVIATRSSSNGGKKPRTSRSRIGSKTSWTGSKKSHEVYQTAEIFERILDHLDNPTLVDCLLLEKRATAIVARKLYHTIPSSIITKMARGSVSCLIEGIINAGVMNDSTNM